MIIGVRFYVIIGLVIYFYVLVKMIHTKKISINHAIPWLFIGIVMGIFDFFPVVLTRISQFLGIQIPLNAFFVVSILFIFLELIAFTASISVFNRKILELTQIVSILEKRVRELEQQYQNEDNI